jgi:hypothetical protein
MNNTSGMHQVPPIFWEIKVKMKMETRSYICTPLFAPTHSRPSSAISDHKRHTTPFPHTFYKGRHRWCKCNSGKGDNRFIYHPRSHFNIHHSPPSYTIQWEEWERCVNPHQLQSNRFHTLAVVIFILTEEPWEPVTAKFTLLLDSSQRPTRITESIKFAFRRKLSTSKNSVKKSPRCTVIPIRYWRVDWYFFNQRCNFLQYTKVGFH